MPLGSYVFEKKLHKIQLHPHKKHAHTLTFTTHAHTFFFTNTRIENTHTFILSNHEKIVKRLN